MQAAPLATGAIEVQHRIEHPPPVDGWTAPTSRTRQELRQNSPLSVGYDAGKKITGRKRHLIVDTLGMELAVVVHGAYWQDHDGACFPLMKLRKLRRLKVIFADSAYARNELPEWVSETFGWLLQTILRPVEAQGFVVLPKRWIVERTFAWISRCRRNSKDYERTTESSEAMIYITMIALMSRRLARQNAI